MHPLPDMAPKAAREIAAKLTVSPAVKSPRKRLPSMGINFIIGKK